MFIITYIKSTKTKPLSITNNVKHTLGFIKPTALDTFKIFTPFN